jgi:rhodanese-related sulfurtransferase
MATKNGTKKPAASSNKTGSAGSATSKALIWTIVVAALVIGGFLLLRPAGGSGGATSVTSFDSDSSSGVTNVDSNGVLKAQQEGVRVIDVRSTGEYEAGHVAGAENVPIDQFAAASTNWDRNAPLLVYCATGARSSEAVKILQAGGFKSIYHFDQGLQAWTGKLDTANTASSATTAAPKPTARPVMYEFYTDW